MYLIDTSVWIDFIRGKPSTAVEQLRAILTTEQTAGICPVIYQEILQGSESEQRFKQFRDYFMELNFYHPNDLTDSYAQAAYLYFSCRRKGITIRSTIDCLIAQTAIEHTRILLHSDRDFMRIAEVTSLLNLKTAVEHIKIPFALSLSKGGRDFDMLTKSVNEWKPFMLRQAQHERLPLAPAGVFRLQLYSA